MRRPLHLLALLLLVASCAVVTACGSDDADSGTQRYQHRARAPPRPRRSRSGLVTDIGGLNDRSFNQLANEGLERAKSELGVETRVLVSKAELGLRAEPLDARAAEVRPRDRRRLPDGRGDEHRRLEVPGHQVRDHRRRRDDGLKSKPDQRRRRCSSRSRRRATSSATWPACTSRTTAAAPPARSAARRSRRSTTTSPATRRA